MFWKRGFGGRGFRALLTEYRGRRAIQRKHEKRLKEWAAEDRKWDRDVQLRTELMVKRQLQRDVCVRELRGLREALIREEQQVEAQIEEWSKTKMLKIRLAGLLTDNPTLEREFRAGRAPQDAEQMFSALTELGKQNRIIDAIKYFEAFTIALKQSQQRHARDEAEKRSRDGQLWRSAGEGIHSHGF